MNEILGRNQAVRAILAKAAKEQQARASQSTFTQWVLSFLEKKGK